MKVTKCSSASQADAKPMESKPRSWNSRLHASTPNSADGGISGFRPSGKTFIPREDIWSKFLSGDKAHTALWYYGPGAVLFFQFLVVSLTGHGNFENELILVKQLLSSLHIMAAFFCYFCVCSGIAYLGVCLWHLWRPNSSSIFRKVYDVLWAFITALFYVTFYAVSTLWSAYSRIKAYPALILTLEQTVFLLKMHAFVHWNVTRVTSYSGDDLNEKIRRPASIQNYIYFLCAPTFVYRDFYPRTNHIRYRWLIRLCIEGSAVCYMLNRMACLYLLPTFRKWRLEHPHAGLTMWDTEFLILGVRTLHFSAFASICIGFYIFHCHCNIVAELTRFADRMFQMDYWNCSTIRKGAALWNMPIHDWLYEYVYIPSYNALPDNLVGHRLLAAVPVIYVSYAFHELVINLTVRSWGTPFLAFYLFAFLWTALLDPLKTSCQDLERLRPALTQLSMAFFSNLMIANLYIRFGLDGEEPWDSQVHDFVNHTAKGWGYQF